MSKELDDAYARAADAAQDYARIRRLVDKGLYDRASELLSSSSLARSTREVLGEALASGEDFIIKKVFQDVDGRVLQALCHSCSNARSPND